MARLPIWNLQREKEIFKEKMCQSIKYSRHWLEIHCWANRFAPLTLRLRTLGTTLVQAGQAVVERR